MRTIITISIFSIFLLVNNACKNNTEESPATSIPTPNPTAPKAAKKAIATKEPNCTPNGKMLDNNKHWISSVGELLYITATDATKDKKMGDSHRQIEVVDSKCNVVFSETLPVNRSADFPFKIADINYSKMNNMIAIKGFDQAYCYDAKKRKLSSALIPQYLNQREGMDAQSGTIQHLELWESYLIGYAKDNGTFVFDLTNSDNIKVVMPYAERALGSNFRSLFVLSSNDGLQQAIAPSYDFNKGHFNINPIFEKPVAINLEKSSIAKNNNLVTLHSDGQEIKFDMKKGI